LHTTLLAADEKPKVTLQFMDAETNAPLVGARILIDTRESYFPRTAWVFVPPDPLEAPQPRWRPPVWPEQYAPQDHATTDQTGTVTVSLPDPDAAMAVLHEKGVAWLTIFAIRPRVSSVSVKLQPWAHLEGRVLRRGKPCAGVVIGVTRTVDFKLALRLTADPPLPFPYYPPSLRHGTTAVSDAEGRFVLERLLPTNIEGGEHDRPYRICQVVSSGSTLKPGGKCPGVTLEATIWDVPAFMLRSEEKGWCAAFECAEVVLQPGQRAKMDLTPFPRCVTEVKGRFVWKDGRALMPSRDLPPEAFALTPTFSAVNRYPVAWGEADAGAEIQEDGRFTATLPLAGPWSLSHQLLSFHDGTGSFEFTLPPAKGGVETGAAVDLGDIVVHLKEKNTP
jgi:hypothetical protein